MNRRPLLVSTAAVSALVLCAAASNAGAATAAQPAAGRASSTLSLLSATAAGHTVRVGDLTLLSDTLTSSTVSKIVVTPVTADGTTVGEQVITPESSSFTVPSQSSPSALGSVVSLTSPAFTTAATNDPSSHAGAASLGSVSLVGLPISLAGSVDLGTSVSSVNGALAGKTVVLKDLALPSIADLLAALGLDLSKLPISTLNTLVNQLGLVNATISAAQAAASAALAQVDAALQTVGTATTALTQANADAATAATSLTSATTALQALLDTVPAATLLTLPGANTISGFLALSPANQALVEALVPGLAGAVSTYNAAQTAATAAQTAVSTATAALAAAEAALAALTSTLQSLLAPLLAALTAVLDDTPLLSIDSLTLTSKAAVTSAKTGGQQAEVLGGSLTGLHVLGTDVLDNVLGNSTLNLTDLVGGVATTLTGAITDLTDTLSSVLSTVPGLPTLSIPAPTVSVLTKSATTSISGGFGRAATTVNGLTVSLPAISLPTSIALPNAASLPALSGVTQTVAGVLSSAPVSLELLTLSDQSAFRPAVVAVADPTTTPGTTPTTPTSGLPSTGLPAGLALLALTLVGGSLVLRRRAVHAE